MSVNPLAPMHVRKFYPNAIRSAWFLQSFIWFAKYALGKTEEQIAFLSSICSDDLNSVELPDTAMIGPFTLGGLDGYPFVGKTGIGAFSHHVPEHGVAMMFFGPHIGITDREQVGKVLRPGQQRPSDCCGAAQKALAALEAGLITPKRIEEYDRDDYQQESLEQIILPHASEILGAGSKGDPRRIMVLTDVVYRATLDSMKTLLSTVKCEEPAFAFGGILINEDGGVRSDIDLRIVLRVDKLKVVDVTATFQEQTAGRFKSLEEGNLEAFK